MLELTPTCQNTVSESHSLARATAFFIRTHVEATQQLHKAPPQQGSAPRQIPVQLTPMVIPVITTPECRLIVVNTTTLISTAIKCVVLVEEEAREPTSFRVPHVMAFHMLHR